MFHKAPAVVPTISVGIQVHYEVLHNEVIPQLVNLNAFADDHMVHKCFKPDIEHLEHKCIEEPERCLLVIHIWMNENKPNEDRIYPVVQLTASEKMFKWFD